MASSTPDVPLDILAKLITPEKLHELAVLVKKEHPDVTEIPIERVNEFIARHFSPTTEMSSELLTKRAPTDVPDPELIQVVVGHKTFNVPRGLLTSRDSIFASSKRRVFPQANPNHFKYLLKLLDGDTSFLPNISEESLKKLRECAAYFGFFDLLTKPISMSRSGNLASLKPSLASSSITNDTSYLTNTDPQKHTENSYGSDSNNPWWELNFKASKVIVTSASLGISTREGPGDYYNFFSVALLVGFTETNPSGDIPGEPYMGEIPTDSDSAKGVKAWRVIGTASSEENKTGVIQFSLSTALAATSLLRVQFRRHSKIVRPVKLRVYNLTVNGVGVVTL